jgi:magnesium transporter
MRAADGIDDSRERLIMLREMHMNRMSNRMNSIMKILTVWATIFLPLTFLAGVWGMNFKFMPELFAPWGYWAALGLMAAVAAVMVVFFKIKKWL